MRLETSLSKSLLATALLTCSLVSSQLMAETVEIQHEGITLNAELELAEGSSLADGVLILTHGTLAHSRMELISMLQELFVDAGVNTLAVNLSLGIDNREQAMYDCSVPARHTMQQGVAEISAWQDWLDSQSAGPRWLMGHSRGGNQTAQYTLADATRVNAQILLAPATWNLNDSLSGYQKRYSTDVNELLAKAQNMNGTDLIEGASILYCENSGASAASLLSYYGDYPNYDTPTVLAQTDTPTLVIAGSLDTVVADLPVKMASINKDNVEMITIEDADHFFLDLFSDEAVEYAVEFIQAQ